MLAVERQKKIMQILHREGIVKVSETSVSFGVSEETIRRDLQKLEKDGGLSRTYGGAYITKSVNPDIHVSIRESFYLEGKEDIGVICAEMIEEGDTIFLDSSTTALHIAEKIKHEERITVVTNSVKVITTLADSEIKIIGCGGSLRPRSMSLVGNEAECTLNHYYTDKAFVSCTSVDLDRGLTDTNEQEARIRKLMLERSAKKILIADATKFGKISFAAICPLTEIDIVVSDKLFSSEWSTELKKLGIEYFYKKD